MKIEKIPVGQIKVADWNPRDDLKPGDPEYDAIKRSLDRWSLVQPLVLNVRSGRLVGGAQRFKILVAEGATHVDCSVVDLSDDEESALNLALNKIQGRWDEQKLFTLLTDLDTKGMDITLAGFDKDYLGSLAKDLDTKLFTPVMPEEEQISSSMVTGADMDAAQKKINSRFEKKDTVQDVICPHCMKVFGVALSGKPKADDPAGI